ncbi:hypothetical protein [Spirillospora sp. NPDC029432]|uniref:hypothetical protein n=1 Tax=Spirillospora sp. NPDC029432 TaxID=3154599 RepID=UPI003451FC13
MTSLPESADSYRKLGQLLTDTGLDPTAAQHASLYASASGADLPALASTTLRVPSVRHDQHVFRFRNARHLADYITTIPKYRLGPLAGAPAC